MKSFITVLVIIILAVGVFFVMRPRRIVISDTITQTEEPTESSSTVSKIWDYFKGGDKATTTPADTTDIAVQTKNGADEPFQPRLENPPTIVKGIYITGWVAGLPDRMTSLLGLVKRKGLNAVVIDVKDYSGYVSYETTVPEVQAVGAEDEIRIRRPNALIKQLHDNGIYVIARISIFQDPILAKAHPEWALKNSVTGNLWKDRKGLAWMDVAAQPVWDYNVALARDAFARGFDEVNFDYIRFPSDGDLSKAVYPYWNKATPRSTAVAQFFTYIGEQFPHDLISADLFGLATINKDDMGIGQIIEDGYESFDYVSPMIYPSHYAAGFIGYKNPALYPYEVIQYSMEHALKRLVSPASSSSTTTTVQSTPTKFRAKLRPWLQVFDLGATYDHAMIQKQVQAVEDVMLKGEHADKYAGYLFWDPKVVYGAL